MKKKYILLIATVLFLLLVLTACFHKRKASLAPAQLTFYGLDDSDVFEQIIAAYRQKQKNVKIKYKKFNDPAEFENLIISEIAEGEGPDIFYIHHTWLPRHIKKLVPFSPESFSTEKFEAVFVKVAAENFVQPDPNDGKKKIYALPLYVDTLALYYNKKHFEQKIPERGKPAKTWAELKEDAQKLREQAEDGTLKRGAIALGRADNIRLASDILYHFFLQAGVKWYDENFKQVSIGETGREALEEFVSFAIQKNKNFSWSTDLVSPEKPLKEIEAFLSGSVSAILGYSDLFLRLGNDLKNVKTRQSSVISLADIGVTASPQFSVNESDARVWISSYGLGVSRNSKNFRAASDFIQFVTSQSNARAYLKKTKRPTARRDLIEEQRKEPILDVFVSQLGYAGSARIFSYEKFSEFLREAIQGVINGQTSSSALSQAESKMNEILKNEAPEGLYPKPKVKKK